MRRRRGASPSSARPTIDGDAAPRPKASPKSPPAQCEAISLGRGGVIAVGLTLAACGSRLLALHHPETPIFDETHVGRFLNWYVDRAFFFDVHGPLAKMLMLWTARVLGFEGRSSCPYESTEPYAAPCSLAAQRLVPALCGSALVPLTFATCCAMRLHPLASFLAAWLVLVDTLWIGLSRVHLNDMVQMLFIALTFRLALDACAVPSGGDATSRPSRSKLLSLAATGVALGCALQCKYAMALTTLGWLGLQNVATLAGLAAARAGSRALLWQAGSRGALLLGIPLLMHLCLLRLHLAMLPNTGNGDGYMSEAFQATLDGNPHALARASASASTHPSFWAIAWEHAQAQFYYNRNMAILFPRGSHGFDSPWYTWPLARRGVYFNLVANWDAVASSIGRRHTYGIFLHPNPLITLATTALVALAAAGLVARLLRALWRARSSGPAASAAELAAAMQPGGVGSLVLAYLLHWLPYATQERQTFLHYYLPAYYFAILLSARAWHAVGCAHLRPQLAAAATLALAAAAARVSWIIAPIAYGSPVTVADWTAALRLASTECWRGADCWASPSSS